MRLLLVLILMVSNYIIDAQTNPGTTPPLSTVPNVLLGDRTCDCEILLYTTSGIPSGTGPIYATGDLDEFEKMVNGECTRSVNVYRRYLKAGIFDFKEDFMVNNVNTLLDKYKDNTSICFLGGFGSYDPIVLKGGKVIKLLDDSFIKYIGQDGPVFDIQGNNNIIDGGGNGEIRMQTAMPTGAIRLNSDGLAVELDGTSNNVNYNQIKNISITNTATNGTGPPDATTGSTNQGIFLSNNPESIYEHSDNGSNYYTNISNVEISGFSTGIHARGWSNAVLIRDISMSDISAYGIWVSGCIDNSFANIRFDNCSNAAAIRLDSYIDERHTGFTVAGQTYSVLNPITNEFDPNIRKSISLIDPLNTLFGMAADEGQLADLLHKSRPSSYIHQDLLGYNMIKEACGKEGKTEYGNELGPPQTTGGPPILRKFGLLGYEEDVPDYPNYDNDKLNVFKVFELTLVTKPDSISFYKKNFKHAVSDDPITLDKATCKESELLTNFYRPAFLNSFSQINILDENGLLQVAHVLELSEREDDENLCLQNSETDSNCNECGYINSFGKSVNNVGSRNKLHVCALPNNTTMVDLIDNKSGCDYLNGYNNVPVVTIVNQ